VPAGNVSATVAAVAVLLQSTSRVARRARHADYSRLLDFVGSSKNAHDGMIDRLAWSSKVQVYVDACGGGATSDVFPSLASVLWELPMASVEVSVRDVGGFLSAYGSAWAGVVDAGLSDDSGGKIHHAVLPERLKMGSIVHRL